MKEIWKPIEGFVGLYAVSSLGRIQSFKGPKPRILKPWTNTTGKALVTLFKDGIKYKRLVRRLVAEAFVPPYKGRVVGYKDPTNMSNAASNLVWTTYTEIYKNNPTDEEGLRCSAHELPKYIYPTSDGRFKASPYIGGRRVSAGVYDTIDEALAVIKKAFEGDLPLISIRQHGVDEGLPPGLQKTRQGTYRIIISDEQHQLGFGTYKNRSDAERVLDTVRQATRKGQLHKAYREYRNGRKQKHLYKNSKGKYVVAFKSKGTSKYIGTYEDVAEATEMAETVERAVQNGTVGELPVFVKKSGLPKNVVKQKGLFVVQFIHKKQRIYVGCFNSVEDAVAARDKARRELNAKS